MALAALYALSLNLSRESTDEQVTKAYKRVALKVHPDKGGAVEHAQQVNLAKEAWEKAKKKAKGPGGRAREQPEPGPASGADEVTLVILIVSEFAGGVL